MNSIDGRIVNGQDAVDDQFPYMVSLRDNRGHFCGGFVLTSRYAGTAAHCIDHLTDANINSVSPNKIFILLQPLLLNASDQIAPHLHCHDPCERRLELPSGRLVHPRGIQPSSLHGPGCGSGRD